MDDRYIEEQEMEWEALSYIYPDEIELIEESPKTFSIHVVGPVDEELENEDIDHEDISFDLKFTYTDTYPDIMPGLEILSEEGILSDTQNTELLNMLNEKGDESLGMVMVHTLVTAAQEWTCETNTGIMKCKIEEMQKKVKEEQEKTEAEEKAALGIPVTMENFIEWKHRFDQEMVKNSTTFQTTKQKKTGRQLFEDNQELIKSDQDFDSEDLIDDLSKLTVMNKEKEEKDS